MTRQTWEHDNFYISYGNPVITAFSEKKKIKSFKEVMYFYYDITILNRNKIIAKYEAYDFPKVQYLPYYINKIVNDNMANSLILEDTHNGFVDKTVKYTKVDFDDDLGGYSIEYFYKIERYDTTYKDDITSEYVLTIGELIPEKDGGSFKSNFGKCIIIKDLSKDDLIRLKTVAENFCGKAIEQYNKLGY